MKKYLILVLALALSIPALAQEEAKEKKVTLKAYGFVKNDMIWDSRKITAAREGHFHFWPEPVVMDAAGNDINAASSFNFFAIQSRVGMKISGPDVFGAKASAMIEGDFFAQSDPSNMFRLRHALVKLNWEKLELMTGQFWNPLMVTSCFPGTVSFNTGAPLQSFARNPQIRATYKFGGLSLIGALLSQRDQTNIGGAATLTGAEMIRYSVTPDMHFQLHFNTDNEEGFNVLAGAAIAYKTIAPRITSSLGYSVKERMGGLTLMAFTKLSTGPVTIKLQGRYGENISDVLAISGFGVTGYVDNVTLEQAYTPLKSMTIWGEVHTNGNPQVGIFGGFMQNLGSKEALALDLFTGGPAAVYGRGISVHSLYRVVPRVIYNIEKVRLALELEYTAAAYGSGWDEFYLPTSTSSANNLRVLASVYYFF